MWQVYHCVTFSYRFTWDANYLYIAVQTPLVQWSPVALNRG
jgi:hypothetical protein